MTILCSPLAVFSEAMLNNIFSIKIGNSFIFGSVNIKFPNMIFLVIFYFVLSDSLTNSLITETTWKWEYPYDENSVYTDTHYFPYYTTYKNISNNLDGHFFTIRASEVLLEMNHYWKNDKENCSQCEHMQYYMSFGQSPVLTWLPRYELSLCKWLYDDNHTHNVLNLKQIFFDKHGEIALIKDKTTEDYIIAVTCTFYSEISEDKEEFDNRVKSLVKFHKLYDLELFEIKRDISFYLKNSDNYHSIRDLKCEETLNEKTPTLKNLRVVSLVVATIVIIFIMVKCFTIYQISHMIRPVTAIQKTLPLGQRRAFAEQ